MLRFAILATISSVLCLACSCSSRTQASRVTPLAGAAPILPPSIAAAAASVEEPRPQFIPEAPAMNRAPVEPMPQGWLSWSQVAHAAGWPQASLQLQGTNASWELVSATGKLGFKQGSRIATWNGFSVGLGFAPLFTNNQPYFHALDVIKVLRPIAEPAALLTKPRKVLVLDPGHGGENAGARSVLDQKLEKEFTLDWALRIKKLVEQSDAALGNSGAGGWTVVLTRTNDVDVSLAERVALADLAAGDLFLSLHFNSAGAARDQGGIETYCFTPQGMSSHLTREYADDSGTFFPNNAFDTENLQLALRFHTRLIAKTGQKDRGVRRARFMTVLREQNRPAVLLEGGYLSNPLEARLIASASHRQLLAEAVVEALQAEK